MDFLKQKEKRDEDFFALFSPFECIDIYAYVNFVLDMTDLPYHEFFAMYTDLNEMLDWILFAMDMDTEMPDWSLGENSGCGCSMLDWTGLLVFLFVGVLDYAVLWSAWICFLSGFGF